MDESGLFGLVAVAALAAFFLTRAASAMRDAAGAGYVDTADNQTAAPVDDVIEPYTDENAMNNVEVIQQNDPASLQDGTAMPSKLSADGLARLMQREGFSAVPYYDHAGQSIGYGHLILPGENLTNITREQAGEILARDVEWAEKTVYKNVNVLISQNAFDALVSFCFNVGIGGFTKSTLLKKVNAFDATAADEFSKWIYVTDAGVKRVHPALAARRDDEQSQFLA